jgi:hypothetical protein
VCVRACVRVGEWVCGRLGMWGQACSLLTQNAKRMRRVIICVVSSSNIFFDIISSTARSSEKITAHKLCILIFSTTFNSNISHSNKNSKIYCHKCENVFTYSTRYSCQILVKLKFSRYFVEKSSNFKFKQNTSSGTRVSAWGRKDGRTDGHDEGNSRFSQF